MTVDASSLRRGAVGMGAVTLAGFLVDYAFNLGLTRFLSPHEYGDFKVAYSFAFLLGAAVLLGGDRAAPRFLAPCLERGESGRVWEYLRFYFGNALLLGAALAVVTWALAALHVGSVDPGDHHVLSWAVLAVPLNAAAALVSRTLQSARRPAQAVVPWRIGLPLLQLGIFAAVVTIFGELTAVEAVLIGVVATAAIAAGQWLQVRRLGLVVPRRDPEARDPRAWLSSSLPMMGSFLVAVALNQSDLYFLEALGDETEVGHYAAASMAAHFVPLVQVALVGLIAPLAGPALERGPDASDALFRRGQTWMLSLLLPVGALLSVLGGPLLALFGPQYAVGHGVLLFLVWGNFTWAAAALPSLWLQYGGRGGVVLVISIATLVLDSILNLVLIPLHGMVGAAAGTAGTLTAAAIAIFFARRRMPKP